MSVVTIGAGSYCHRQDIAEKVAEKLGYECLGDDLLTTASERYGVPESTLAKALAGGRPTFLAFQSRKRSTHVAYVQATLLAALKQDNVVFHCLAGHSFVQGVSHVVKVRLMADLPYRAQLMMQREALSEKKARNALERETRLHKSWSMSAFGFDETDPARCDLAINVAEMEPERAAELIADMARDVKFKPMTYSVKCMLDCELAFRVQAELIARFPGVTVEARDGKVTISIRTLKRQLKRAQAIKEEIESMDGVSYVEVKFITDIILRAIDSMR